ncbi:ribbon-helix-helix domain-containing protein [Sandaracinus amylolyticus]|uniref:ribbon-helix-helix domain-containing protein n=1 Tax=Sandaracinus amylolyticus TaxID=927083 RepID=UPI003AF3DC44|nr:Hypothetical protein I5071_63530 [Sandaracinus amylolyticus]
MCMSASERSERGIRDRKRGPAVAYVTAYVAPELARELKMRAAAEGRTGSELVERAIAAMLHGEGAGQSASMVR